MKKLPVFIIGFVLCLQCAVCAGAQVFEAELYSVNLPDGFYQAKEGGYISDNGSTFAVTLSDNSEVKLCFADMNEKKIDEYTSMIAEASTDAFASVGMEGEIAIVSSEKVKHQNGKTAIVTVVKTSAVMNGKKVESFQKMYEFTGENNKFTFAYTPGEESSIDDLDEAFNSIEIKEAEIDSMSDKAVSALMYIAILLLIIVGIAKFFIKPKPKKKKDKK